MIIELANKIRYKVCKICGSSPMYTNKWSHGYIFCNNCNIEIKLDIAGEWRSKDDIKSEGLMQRYELRNLYKLLLIWNNLMEQ